MLASGVSRGDKRHLAGGAAEAGPCRGSCPQRKPSAASAGRTRLHTGDSCVLCAKREAKAEARTGEQSELPGAPGATAAGGLRKAGGVWQKEKIWRKFPVFAAFPLKWVTVTAARDNGYLDRNPLFLV